MRRTSRILFKIIIVLLVLTTLAVGVLRYTLPRLNDYRQPILDKISSVIGVPTHMDFMHGEWVLFGPTFDLRDITFTTNNGIVTVSRITVALDVWHSLLRLRWQFRDLTFYHVNGDLDFALADLGKNASSPERATLENLFFKQFDHFILRESRMSFLGLSGERVTLDIPHLTWKNGRKRHQAEGEVSVTTKDGPHGLLQVRLDLRDEAGLLDSGTVYLQADDFNMLPWLTQWFKASSGFENAHFSLASWLYLNNGEISGGDVLLSQGDATWSNDRHQHRLDVDNLTLHMRKQPDGWRVDAPALNLKTDGVAWPKGQLSLFWQPEAIAENGEKQEEQLRIRARDLRLEQINPLLPMFNALSPDALDMWQALQPQGVISQLALDIPLNNLEQSRFQTQWQGASWQPWRWFPGVNNLNAVIAGSRRGGSVTLDLNHSVLPYDAVFRAPLEISRAQATINWVNDADRFRLWGENVDVQATALWLNGSFEFNQPTAEPPWLNILAGIRADDAGEAWRYFPEPLMGKPLVDYLSAAILAGKSAADATLIFSGDPQQFPFHQREGLFQVYAPLTETTFQFQPDWLPLTDMTITLDFVNDGLWMQAPTAKLGRVDGSQIDAIIAPFDKEHLTVDANVNGDGLDVRAYLNQSPLQTSVGAALEEVEVSGNVSGRLHLEIPLNGADTTASGDVTLRNNRLHIKPIDALMENVSGRFHFDNGRLTSQPMTAQWFEQPVNLHFTTQETAKAYQVNVGIGGNWAVANLPWLPESLAAALTGVARWKSDVYITLPQRGLANYRVAFNGDLSEVSSHLPAPLDKLAGTALPVTLQAEGDVKGFRLSGRIDRDQAINSQWLLTDDKIHLARFAWQPGSDAVPALPADERLSLALPALNGDAFIPVLASLLAANRLEAISERFSLPRRWHITSPEVDLAGQFWRDIQINVDNQSAVTRVMVDGKEINAQVSAPNNQPWQADIAYLYYYPKTDVIADDATATNPTRSSLPSLNLARLPALLIRCQTCWVLGQRLGEVQADLQFRADSMRLTNGLIDSGDTRLRFNADWLRSYAGSASRIEGKLTGQQIDQSLAYFGVITPLKEAPFDVDFQLTWQGAPWSPQVDTLNGQLVANLGRGEITDAVGSAGQLLRLLSFNELLRKLRFDFSDTFGSDFGFDTITGNVTFARGIATTNNVLVSGSLADITLEGSVDLVQQRLDLNAAVAPVLSGTVGIATAFVINPIAGVVVFATGQVLSPLWNKISLIRYKIDGTLENPVVNEVSRQPKEEDSQ